MIPRTDAISLLLLNRLPKSIMFNTFSVRRGGLFLFCFLFLAMPLIAQNSELHGLITDPSQAAISNATVEMINPKIEARWIAKSNDRGIYTIPSLPAGTYQVITRAAGFSANVNNEVTLSAGQSLIHNVQLAIKSVQSEVSVQATIATIPDTDLSVGPLSGKKLTDLPYSIIVLPNDLIENQQATSFRELIKYMPSVQIEERGGSDVGRPQTRGFEGTVAANTRFDGLNFVATTAHPMEMFERIEVLNGLSGSLTGPAQPAGSFNFVIKRPTDTPLRQVTIKYDNQNSPTIYSDLGGHIGKNKKFGYRFVLLYGNGEGFVDGSNLERGLASMALDWRFLKNTIAEINFSYYSFDKKGFPGGFSYGPTLALPNAPDASRVGYGQKWAGSELYTRTESIRVRHDINKDWHISLGFLDQSAERGFTTPTNTLSNNSGSYASSLTVGPAGRHEVSSNIGYLTGHFNTGWMSHDISAGTNGFQWRTYGAAINRTIKLGAASLANPVAYDQPDLSTTGSVYKAGRSLQQALVANDTITFNKSWSVLLSFNHSWLTANNWNLSGVKTSHYEDNGMSYGASLLYKPAQNITAYYTYADNLQQGDISPSTGVANPNEILAPYRSEQHEVGIKASVSRVSFTLAGFRIERPFAFTDPADYYFKVGGNQRNYGLEIMATGEVFRDLTAYGGVTLLDPRLQDTGKVATSNKQVVGVPKAQANLLLEYRLPLIRGLSFNMNWHHTGKRAANDTNASWAAGYHTVDLGMRYTTRFLEHVPLTWRLEADNVGNTFYWASIFPSSINGTSGSYSAFLGPTRTIMASVQAGF
jgi:iron complex outermembrane recepter protein